VVEPLTTGCGFAFCELKSLQILAEATSSISRLVMTTHRKVLGFVVQLKRLDQRLHGRRDKRRAAIARVAVDANPERHVP
jgi:hypothetical protein